MKLSEWLTATNTKPSEFAQRIRMTEASVSRLRHNRQIPTLETLARIREATGGQVDAVDFEVATNQAA